MKVSLDVSSAAISSLMISAIESGDAVTTASRGGWCAGIFHQTREADPPPGIWYAEEAYWNGEFEIEIIELDDETEVRHKVTPDNMAAGLAVMAKKFPHAFAQILQDDTDSICADLFLQSIVFGEDKYG